MSQLDDTIANFITVANGIGQYFNGDDSTDIQTLAGKLPSLAKQVKQAQAQLSGLVPDLSNLLLLDGKHNYSDGQRSWGRYNLGLDQVNNTADVDKPASKVVQAALDQLTLAVNAKESKSQRNVAGGYLAYDNNRVPIIGLDGVTYNYLVASVTVGRTYTLPDKNGAFALLSDITGTNSGTNTGDETATTIKSKLGVTTLSGSNTGDFDSVVTVARASALPNTGVPKRLYITADTISMYYWTGTAYQQLNASVSNSDLVPEGQSNLYFTQLRAASAVLTSYVAGTGGTIDSGDTIVNAISKLQTQINAAVNDYTARLALRENISNKATDFNVVNNTLYPTIQAVKNYADNLLSGLIKDCGNWDASGNTFPATGGSGAGGAIKRGNLWYVSVAGTLGGVAVNIGDSFRALVDNPGQTASNWGVLESNLGYVPYNATNPAGYISAITGAMVTSALGYSPLNPNQKDASNGVVGMTNYAINSKNVAGTTTSFIQNNNAAARTYTLPDKDGVFAMISDLAGLSSGNGGETQASILQKLGATTVTGSNTGDQTITLTGDVTGNGTGSFGTTIAPNAVGLAKMAQVAQNVILGRVSNGAGNVEALSASQLKTMAGLDQVNNTTDLNKPVSTATQAALSGKEDTTNKATDFSVADNVRYPTTLAVKTLLDARLTSVIVECGNWDATSGNYPTNLGTGVNGAIKKGNLFFVSVAGSLGGVAVNIGDSFRALIDNPGQTAGNWAVLESNIGYVPYNATNPAGYISGITGAMVTTALGFTPVSNAKLMAQNGVPALINYDLGLLNSTGTQVSTLKSVAAVARTYTLPDKTGTLAMVSDITGTNSGTNTGDETQATILSKLSVSTLTGSNTGDETGATIRSKLSISTLSGSNTGDETQATILAKLAFTPLNKAGDTLAGPLNFAAGASVASADTLNLTNVSSNVVDVTGTTIITSITLADGQFRLVRFAAVTTVNNNANIAMPTGANITTAPGDYALFVGRASGVHCVMYMPASGMPLFGNAREKVRNILANSGATTIDLNNGDNATVFKVTIAANTTITFTNPPPSPNGEVFNFTLITINDGTAGRAMAFGNTMQWAGGNLPPRTTAANARDVWAFYIDSGTYGGSLAIEDQK